MADAETILRKRLEICSKSKSTFGPFVMFVGKLDEDGSEEVSPEVRVYVEENRFLKISSNCLLDGVDVCFKFVVLPNIPFLPKVKHLWNFFQKHFYKIDVVNASNYDRVNKFIFEINSVEMIPLPDAGQDIQMENINVEVDEEE